MNWILIGLELGLDSTCIVEKAGPSQPDTYSDIFNIGLPLKGGVAKAQGDDHKFPTPLCRLLQEKKFFCVFPVTSSQRLIINTLGCDRDFFSCHAPITHVTAT